MKFIGKYFLFTMGIVFIGFFIYLLILGWNITMPFHQAIWSFIGLLAIFGVGLLTCAVTYKMK